MKNSANNQFWFTKLRLNLPLQFCRPLCRGEVIERHWNYCANQFPNDYILLAISHQDAFLCEDTLYF